DCWRVAFVFFFFQAEDGIRDWSVTGVQTCALPISPPASSPTGGRDLSQLYVRREVDPALLSGLKPGACGSNRSRTPPALRSTSQIGRASCRERGGISVVALPVKRRQGWSVRETGRR